MPTPAEQGFATARNDARLEIIEQTMTVGETYRISDHYLNAPDDFSAALHTIGGLTTQLIRPDGTLIVLSTCDLADAIAAGEITIRDA